MTALLEKSPFHGLADMVPQVPIWRMSVDQYHEMLDAGILQSGDPIELLEGWLVIKMTKNRPHVVGTRRLCNCVSGVLPASWHVESQDPITTLESEPEPDMGVIRGKLEDYPHHHPKPADVGMIGEVADSSLDYDRGIKKRVYARAQIPIYWIVNLEDNCIEVYTDPTGPADKPDYRQCKVYGPDDSVPVILDGQEIGRLEVKQILP